MVVMSELFDADNWEKAWRNDSNTGVNKMKKAGIDPAHAFDKKATLFNEQAFSEEGKQRSKRILNWIEGQGVAFDQASILDIGAASGGFSVPFAKRGAVVTALEPCVPLAQLLEQNNAGLAEGKIRIVTEAFEHIDVDASGWRNAFDVVFVSMCPVIVDWESVEKVLSCGRKFCYISLPVGGREHNLIDDIWTLVTDQPRKKEHLEMAYLLQLLLLKGYAYESLVTRETKTTEVSREIAFQDVMNWLSIFGLSVDEPMRRTVRDYLERVYPADKVEIRESGRYGKVLIRLQDQHMYTR
ncbi:hypothetical protein DFP97_1019 [Paenibacillus prosopidis]|uniref:Methyltransferase family protein n=2 Tax=Paenibacillus prosopidis TaxID=630520 RepID=A0A368W7W1_9BACL|nr:hypothetical protein DFP97_1019 [Paenibacillus prosopidis]